MLTAPRCTHARCDVIPPGGRRSPGLELGLRRGSIAISALMAAAALAGCSEDDSGVSTLQPTQLVVFPSELFGEVECSAEPGAAHSYVVTLSMWDDDEDVSPFVLGSSYPSSCTRPVTFQDVLTPGKLYTAEVDAYDRFADELAAFGSRSSGARQMEDADTGFVVEPRWTTSCGTGPSEATMAQLNQSHAVAGCQPLAPDETNVTAIAVPPAAILGADPCSTAPLVDVFPEDPTLAAATGIPCESEPLLFDQGIVEGQAYDFYATADVDGVPHGTLCFATAKARLTVTVQCGDLRSTGDVQLDLTEVLVGGEEPVCPPGYRYDVALEGAILNAAPLGCEGRAQIGPLSPGDYELDVTVLDAEGQHAGDASCSASVVAGRAVQAACTALP